MIDYREYFPDWYYPECSVAKHDYQINKPKLNLFTPKNLFYEDNKFTIIKLDKCVSGEIVNVLTTKTHQLKAIVLKCSNKIEMYCESSKYPFKKPNIKSHVELIYHVVVYNDFEYNFIRSIKYI